MHRGDAGVRGRRRRRLHQRGDTRCLARCRARSAWRQLRPRAKNSLAGRALRSAKEQDRAPWPR
eukprot:5185263-Alexandrium_andersonii.AAC.1